MSKKRKKVTLVDVYAELQSVKRQQKQIMKFEKEQLKREIKIAGSEKKELEELEALEDIEKMLKVAVGSHPLRSVTIKDVVKGGIGAFIGTTAHYSFIYGVKVAQSIDLARAILLFPLAFAIGALFLYFTGFRKIKNPKLIWFLPIRLLVLFMTSLIVSFLVLYLLQPDFINNPVDMFKTLATVQLSAIIGACTADLIGKNE